jgi:hypothetical protein
MKAAATIANALLLDIFRAGSPLGIKRIAARARDGDRRAGKDEAIAKAEAKRERKGAKLRALAAKGAIAS